MRGCEQRSPLRTLNFEQQRYEADFRFNLVRFRENMEGVALYRGEDDELRGFRFTRVFSNWWQITRRRKLLNFFSSGYSQVAIIFPFVVAAPRFFSGAPLLHRPAWLFLDEATSQLDYVSQTRLYEVLMRQLEKSAVVSIAHRDELARYHPSRLELRSTGDGSHAVRVIEVPPTRAPASGTGRHPRSTAARQL